MKYLCLYVMLAISIPCLSQNAKPIKYRIFEKCRIYKDKMGDFISDSKWENCNILLVVKTDPQLLTIYNDKIEKYDLAKSLGKYEYGGNIIYRYQAADLNGTSCIVRFLMFDDISDGHLGTCYIDYQDMTYVFRLKSNE